MNTTDAATRVVSGAFLAGPGEAGDIFVPELFGEEPRMIARTVQDFVTEQVLPRWEAIDAQEPGLLEELARKTGELGVFALDVPEEMGGLGAPKTTAMLVSEKVGRGASYAPAIAVQTGIGGLPILYFGTEEQRTRWAEGIVTGEILTAYALTEAGSGSDALGARATATLDEAAGVYRLNGSKQFITNAGIADLFIVFAKVDGEHFTAFVVERGAEGFTVGAEEHKLGLKGSSTCALTFEDTPVPTGNVLGEIGKGHRIAFNVLNIGRLKLSPVVLGGAKISLATGTQYALERHQFGQPLAAFPLIQQKLAGACALIYCQESLVYRTAHDIDRFIEAADGDKAPATVAALKELSVECSINKVYGSEASDWIVDEMLQVHGGYGYINEYPAERHYRDSRINRIWEGTSEINRMIITGTLLERAMKGELPLMAAMQEVTDQLMSRSRGGDGPEGPYGAELKAVELARKQTLFAAGVAAKKHMADLQAEQEVLAWLADMIIQTYVMESAVLRAQRVEAEGLADEGGAAARRAAARLAIERGVPIVEAAARQALAASAEGEELRSVLSMHRKLTRREPFDVRAEGRRLAAAVTEAGGYPFDVV